MDAVINVLFLGGSKRVSIADVFIRTGIELNKDVKIFSYELDNCEPIAQVGKIIIGLKWNDAGILDNLKRVIKENQIQIVVPFVDIATILCATLKEQLPGIHFCISTEFISRTMFDKRKAHDWFISNNIQVPSLALKLPLIAKINKGSGAKGIKYLHTQAQFDLFFNEEDMDNYFIQELIEGEEFSVDCYVDKKENVVSIVPRQRLEVTNGEATKSITVKDDRIINQSREILHAGDFSGPVTIQFIREKITNKLYLIEINPRLGSGVLTSITAGSNICKFILFDYLNMDNDTINDWKENLLMVRAYKEYYFNATNN